jgi:uncharacterized protein YndB with AHSA1/START domain
MMSKRLRTRENVIHLEKTIKAFPARVFSAFRSSRALNRWYDPKAQLSQFKVGGEVRGDFFPGYQLTAIVKNQLIAQEFKTVIDGIGLWSFVMKRGKTQLIFDHVAEGNQGEEKLARTFYWKGLLENLAAVSEGRPLPFLEGEYPGSSLPRSIHHRTCQDFLQAHRRKQKVNKS